QLRARQSEPNNAGRYASQRPAVRFFTSNRSVLKSPFVW
ncbi:carboxymuconolactone decarboxylase family protein, partial [Vibrio parahaemolyticus EKP-028]